MLSAIAASAQDDILSRARSASTRAEGLARLLYGLMLSWEGRYDDASRELRHVLEQTPAYDDARAGPGRRIRPRPRRSRVRTRHPR